MSRIVRSLGTVLLSAICGAMFFSVSAADAQQSRKAEIHRMLADIYDRQGKVHETLVEYGALVQIAPSDAEAHAAFGKFLFRQKETGLAIRELKRATQLDPSRSDCWAALGNVYLLSRDFNAAIDALRKGGPACAPQLQQAIQYQQQLKQVNQYNAQVKQQAAKQADQ